MAECLTSMHKALGLILRTAKKEKKMSYFEMVYRGQGVVGFLSFSMCPFYTEIPNISAFDIF